LDLSQLTSQPSTYCSRHSLTTSLSSSVTSGSGPDRRSLDSLSLSLVPSLETCNKEGAALFSTSNGFRTAWSHLDEVIHMAVRVRFRYLLILIAHPIAIHYVLVFVPSFLQETQNNDQKKKSQMQTQL
jgi:hypothetical protein